MKPLETGRTIPDRARATFGPDSPEARAVSIAVDRTLGRLLDYLDRTLGEGHVLVALTADHGVAPVPEVLAANRENGGRIRGDFFKPIDDALDAAFGAADWIAGTAGTSPYLDYDVIAQRGLDPADVRARAARAARAMPHVARVYTRDQLLAQRASADPIDARVLRGFNAKRSGDLEIILEPFWIRGSTVATHGTPYNYDAHVPLVLMGTGVAPGRHYGHVALNDLAPTLAAILAVEPPSGSVGPLTMQRLSPWEQEVHPSPDQSQRSIPGPRLFEQFRQPGSLPAISSRRSSGSSGSQYPSPCFRTPGRSRSLISPGRARRSHRQAT